MTDPPALSRRERPAKPALTREGIVEATLHLVDQHGMEQVSLRRVAQALDTGPASLYVYVADRQELFALVHDRVLAEVELPTDADGDWRARLTLLLDRTITALGRHGGIAAVALGEVPTGPHFLRVAEEQLRLLRTGGIDDASCAWAIDLLGLVVTAAGLEESVHQRGGGDEESAVTHLAETFAAVPAATHPTLHALGPLLTAGSGEARRAWALDVLIDGLLVHSAREH